jgi:hypothetical protein
MVKSSMSVSLFIALLNDWFLSFLGFQPDIQDGVEVQSMNHEAVEPRTRPTWLDIAEKPLKFPHRFHVVYNHSIFIGMC